RFALPNGVFARLLPDEQHLSHVDAYNVTLQRELTSTISAEIAYVGNAGRGFIGDGPATNANQPTIVGFGTLSQDQRKPFFAYGVETNPEARTATQGLGGHVAWQRASD